MKHKLKTEGIIFDWTGTLYKRNVGLFPFAEDVIKAIRGRYRLGLVTLAKNGIKQKEEEIEGTGMIYYFDSVIIDRNKTPVIFQRCMNEMGTTAQKTHIVDDRTKRGIMIGNKLGCKTYWITEGEYSHELPDAQTGEPTYRIKSLIELPRLLLT